jgi:hypothetical protein
MRRAIVIPQSPSRFTGACPPYLVGIADRYRKLPLTVDIGEWYSVASRRSSD